MALVQSSQIDYLFEPLSLPQMTAALSKSSTAVDRDENELYDLISIRLSPREPSSNKLRGASYA